VSLLGAEQPSRKISSVTVLPDGSVLAATYDNVSRRNTYLYHRDNAGKVRLIYPLKDGEGVGETIGPGIVFGNSMFLPEENGHLLELTADGVSQKRELTFSAHATIFKERPVVFDTRDGEIMMRDCITDESTKFPGSGIVIQSLVIGNTIYAASVDGDDGECGISGSNGVFVQVKDCYGIVKFADRYFSTSGNKVMEWTNRFEEVAEMPCDKIMRLHLDPDGNLLICGAGPDVLWLCEHKDGKITCRELVRFPADVAVGGSVFRTCVAGSVRDGLYFGRCRGGDTGELHEIRGASPL
jgi:hypothetical protein